MRRVISKSLVLSCDCKRCRSPDKRVKAATFFFGARGEKAATEAAKLAGWTINGLYCLAPGHKHNLHLEPRNKRRDDEQEIDF